MDIVAIIACRNEEAYLANCLNHLTANGIGFAIIDNGSTDATPDILARPEIRKNLIAHELFPFHGTYEWQRLLEMKLRIADRIGADWVIHHDADEVRHSYREGETLKAAIARLAAAGATVVNFEEFVFLPLEHDYVPESPGWQPLRHYYFFQPAPNHRMNAWKTGLDFSMVASGGHRLVGERIRLASESLALRHYIFQTQSHAFRKFAERVYDAHETHELGWHGNRVGQPVESFRFPPASMLESLDAPASAALSKVDPKKKHYWQWDPTAVQ